MPAEYEYLRHKVNKVTAAGSAESGCGDREIHFSSIVSAEKIAGYIDDCGRAGTRVPVCAVILKGLGLVVREHPEARTFFFSSPPRLVQYDECSAAVVVERVIEGRKKFLPAVVRDCDRRTIKEIASDIERLRNAQMGEVPEFRRTDTVAGLPKHLWSAVRFAFKRLQPLQAAGAGTFGFIEAGTEGADAFRLDESFTVTFGAGALEERPVAENGVVTARKTISLTMTFDRRALDEHPAARIFEACVRKLEAAEFLSGEGGHL